MHDNASLQTTFTFTNKQIGYCFQKTGYSPRYVIINRYGTISFQSYFPFSKIQKRL